MTTLALRAETETVARPRFEGSNICTWIGFKHVMYLVEEAVLDHLRQSGAAPRRLYEEDRTAVDIVDSDARILTALHMDDEVRTVVTSMPRDGDGGLAVRTETYVERPARTVKAVKASVRLALSPAAPDGVPTGPGPAAAAHPSNSADGRTPGVIADRGRVGTDDRSAALVGDANAIVWRWRIPYFYCHYSERMQHSGYLRLMEEVVDLFLAERHLSIRTMLAGQGWIPVVPRVQLRILSDAFMEEEIYTVFTVEDIYKDLLYTARMDCFVPRRDGLEHTATGRITHGYAVVLNRGEWQHVPFDERTLAALRGEETS